MGRHTKLTYTNSELELTVNDVDYVVDITAYADYYYDEGCRTTRNGDPGYPPESELTIESIEAIWYCDGNEVEATDEMTSALKDYLYDTDEDDWA